MPAAVRDHRDDEDGEADQAEDVRPCTRPRIAAWPAHASSCSTPSAPGELPDADRYGDEGSDTLGNVAQAVGGLDLPSMEALGLGNVEPLEGCPPQPGAPAVAGRLVPSARRARTRRRATGS